MSPSAANSSASPDAPSPTPPRLPPSWTYATDLSDGVYAKLTAAKPGTDQEGFRRVPYALVLLTNLALENAHRFAPFGWEVNKYLCR